MQTISHKDMKYAYLQRRDEYPHFAAQVAVAVAFAKRGSFFDSPGSKSFIEYSQSIKIHSGHSL